MTTPLLAEWREDQVSRTGTLPPSLLNLFAVGLTRAGYPDWADALAVHGSHIRVNLNDSLYRFSTRDGGPPDLWTLGSTIRVRPGVWDSYVSTQQGRAVILHEVIHVLQHRTRGLLWTVGKLWLPWVFGGQHNTIQAEQEALEVERKVRKAWADMARGV